MMIRQFLGLPELTKTGQRLGINSIPKCETDQRKAFCRRVFSLTSLFSSFNLSTESSILLASINSAYFSVNTTGGLYLVQLRISILLQPLHLYCQCIYMISPFVKRGSGSFRKKDLSKLLMTFRSCHFCRELKWRKHQVKAVFVVQIRQYRR